MIHDGIQFLGLGGEMSVGYVSCLVSGSPGQISGARDNIEKSDPQPSPPTCLHCPARVGAGAGVSKHKTIIWIWNHLPLLFSVSLSVFGPVCNVVGKRPRQKLILRYS